MELITGRTILFPITVDIIDAIIKQTQELKINEYHYNEEWPEADLREAFPVFRELLESNGTDGFNLWLIAEKESRLIIGSAGYMGKPDNEGIIEIGFGIIPGKRGNGFCSESVRALLKWGLCRNGVHTIIARCEKSNTASQKTIARLGFKFIGTDDGLMKWELKNGHK